MIDAIPNDCKIENGRIMEITLKYQSSGDVSNIDVDGFIEGLNEIKW